MAGSNKNLKKKFLNPPAEYRPIPFWFLNSRLDHAELQWQVREMSRKGLGGFFLHARNGLETEYLSEEWLKCLEVAVQEAARLKMTAWLYDEYPYPSGIGGFQVTAHEAYRHRFIDLFEKQTEGSQTITFDFNQGEILLASAWREGDFSRRLSLKEHISGSVLSWNPPKGIWRIAVFIKRVYGDPKGHIFAPDYLNKEAMKFYFSTVHELYAKKLGKYFGKTIPGIFTDEPSIMAWHQTNPWSYRCHHNQRICAWSNSVEERLKDRYGYGVDEVLPAIFYDISLESKNIRNIYRRTVSELYVESFLAPYQLWCEKHNLKLTGHLFQEEGLYANLVFAGNYFSSLKHLHVPGVDHLLKNCERKDGGLGHIFPNKTNVQGQKLVSSIAHTHGKDTVLSETYGASGWSLTMKDMKWIADWQYTLGINLLCPHAFYYSLEGYRKADFPPSLFYQSTFWPYYKKFADYIGRLSCLLRNATHQAKIALVYPLLSFQHEFKQGEIGKADETISNCYDFLASTLLKLHYDYDIVNEDMVQAPAIKNGKLYIAAEGYEALLFPPFTIVREENLRAAQQLVNTGGCVIFSGSFPGNLPGKYSALFSHERCGHIGENTEANLKAILERYIVPHVKIDREEIRYIYKQKDNLHIYFFANTDNKKEVLTTITINNTGICEKWDPETGRVKPLYPLITNKNKVAIKERFSPCGSLLLVIKHHASQISRKLNNDLRFDKKTIDLGKKWTFRLASPNVLILGDWRLNLNLKDIHQIYQYQASCYLNYSPWSIKLLLDDVESRLSLLEEMKLTIKVNNVTIRKKPGYFRDKKFKMVDISSYLRRGRNILQLEFYNVGFGGEPKMLTSYPKLLGNFEIGRENRLIKQKKEIRIGDWAKQGYPCLSGTMIYLKRLKLKKKFNAFYTLKLLDVGDVVEIWVNKQKVKTITWPPYEADVTRSLCNGENLLALKVTNSPANFFEGLTNRAARPAQPGASNNTTKIRRQTSGLLNKVVIEESTPL